MARIPGLRRVFRFPWRTARPIASDVDEELTFHLEMRTQELTEAGLSVEKERAEALREFGDLDAARRSLRNAGAR